MTTTSKKAYILFYGIAMSALFGTLLGWFYVLQSELIELIWPGPTFRPLFNALWLLVVGLLIYSAQRLFGGPMPKGFGLIRADLKENGWSDYRFVLYQMILPAIILTSGTSLGPEATLVSSTVLYGLWITDKVRFIEANYRTLRSSSWAHQLRIVLAPTQFLVRRPRSLRKQSLWSPLTIGWFAVGVMFFALSYNLGGEPSLIIRLGKSAWHLPDLWWLLPVMVLGYVLGRVQLRLMIELRKIILGRVFREWHLILLGGVAIYLASLFAPTIMFSGQHNFHLLAGVWQSQSAAYLVLHAVLKLALITICLNTGWLGGDIFPVLFSATAQGIALSQFLGNVDPIFVISVFAISMGSTVLEAPLVAGGIMIIMFLPPNLMIIGVLVMVVFVLVQRIERRLAKA